MCILKSMVDPACFHIRLPLLKSLEMDEVYIYAHADIIVDAPELEDLDVGCAAWRSATHCHSFTLRAPRLRCLTWSDQFADRVHIDVGKPGAVTSGRIEFTWSRGFDYCREMKDFQAQMMRMLQGLLPDVPPECLADAVRPYITLDKCTANRVAEKLACNLSALMSSLKV